MKNKITISLSTYIKEKMDKNAEVLFAGNVSAYLSHLVANAENLTADKKNRQQRKNR